MLLALLLPSPARAEATGPLRRFALIAGNDEGGDDTRPLLYARDDAQKIHDILVRLGGVRREDAVLVLNGSAEDFLRALSDLERKAQDASRRGERTALFVYYSGHAKDGALRLGRSSVPFVALKNRLAQAPADVRVGIFDACQSGELTRRKGARKAPEFEIQADATQDARGLVILASSVGDEDSQESDLSEAATSPTTSRADFWATRIGLPMDGSASPRPTPTRTSALSRTPPAAPRGRSTRPTATTSRATAISS